MKGALNGINCWYWSMLFVYLANAVPLNPATNETVTETGKAHENVCLYQDERYYEGQNRPSTNPCETCTCQPPDFACKLKSCDVKVGCKALQSAGHCCPKFICDCEKNGHTYGNGEKVEEPNPCNVCYCRGGEIKCTGLTCYTRSDCEPHYVPGKCCPKYDHCPALERQPLATTTAPDQNTTIDEPVPTKQALLVSDEPNQPVGTLEIFEIYPENRTKTVSVTTVTTTEPDVSTVSKDVGNDTEGLVISTAYSRVSIDSPKLAENVLTQSTEVPVTTVVDDSLTSFMNGSEDESFTVESTTTTADGYSTVGTTECADEDVTIVTTEEVQNVTEEDSYSSTQVMETTTDSFTSSSVSEEILDTTTNAESSETTPTTEETSSSKLEIITTISRDEEDSSSSAKAVMGPTLVEMLLKWLQTKRKPEATTALPNITEEARSEPPISILTVLQTELLRMANESKPEGDSRSRSLDLDNNGTSDIEISQQEIADLAAALNDTEDPIRLKYPFTDESLAPVLSMISDQLQFLKVGEEQPIYIEQPPEEDEIEHQHGVVIQPTAPPITVHMVKVVDGKHINDET